VKLRELWLLKYGPFSGGKLDFSSEHEPCGLHLVYGANEAGKSTALRAVFGLLFGIEETTTDAHLYAMPELRIGGVLENRAGERKSVIRRKGRKNTLLDLDDNPLDEALFFRWWGGVSREWFETLFGISHESLVRGGKALLEGEGEVGESLFGAALGVQGFHEARASLEKKAGELFRPRGEKLRLNRALTQFREAKKRSLEKALKPADWLQCEEQLHDFSARRDQVVARRAALRAELGRLERLGRALPVVRTRQQVLERLAALGEVCLVDESCSEQRTSAQGTLQEADREEKKLLDKQQRLEQALASIGIRPAVLELGPRLERLPERIGVYQKAQDDLPTLRSRIELAKEEAAAILNQLGRRESLDEVDRLWVDTAARARIDKLAQEGAGLYAAAAKAESALGTVCDEQRRWQAELAAQPQPQEVRWLKHALQESRAQLYLEEQRRALDSKIEASDEVVKNQLSALPLWNGSVEQARSLRLPQMETAEQFAVEMEALARNKERLEQRKAEGQENLATISAEIAALQALGAIASENDLSQARNNRQALWVRLKVLWREEKGDDGRTADQLVGQYEALVQEADRVADRLWRDAERSAKHAALIAEQGRLGAECAEVIKQLDALADRLAQRWEAWREHWKPAGIEPLRPAEMRAWLGRFEKVLEAITSGDEQRRERARLGDEVGHNRGLCLVQLEALGEAEGAEDQSLSVLVERVQAVVERLEAEAQTRAQLLRDVERVAEQRRKAEAELERCQQAVAHWRQRWASAVAPFGIRAEAEVEEAFAVLEGLSRLGQTMQKIRADQKRDDDIEADARRFADGVHELARACAPELEALPAREAAERLYRIYQDTKEALQRKGELEKQLADNHSDLQEVHQRRGEAQAVLARLLKNAGCESIEALQQAERRSREWRELDARLKDIGEQLAREGVPVDELLKQAEQVDPDELVSITEAQRPEIERADAELDSLQQQIGTLRQKLAQWEGGAEAADAADEAQQALADIKALAESYALTKLASALLTREIERFREQKEGPILRRAGEMFSRMTLGGFDRLVARIDSQDKHRLVCVRNTGQETPVEGLSDGTRDQLYLALRLASLEQHLALNEPLPLILDDAFVNFDDQRTRAALEILSETSVRTQVLLFTHHARMLEIARDVLAPACFKEHILGASA
jgi:uncharacterized protein YhaN